MLPAAHIVFGFTLLSRVLSAPLDINPPQLRESTPEILNLEGQLKKQAGEDKSFYPNLDGSAPEEKPSDLLADESVAEGEDDLGNDLQLLEKLKPSVEEKENLEEEHIKQDNNDGEQKELENDLEHEKEKNEPLIPPVMPQESNKFEDMDDDIDNEIPVGDETVSEEENDQEYANIFLDDVIKALKYHPEMMQNLMDETRSQIADDHASNYAEKRSYGYEENKNNDVHDSIDQFGIQDVDAQDLEAAIRAELMAANRGDRYGYDDPKIIQQMQADDDEWQKYYHRNDNLQNVPYPDNLERYQIYNGDNEAKEVSKKRGYSAPYGYDRSRGSAQNDLLTYKDGPATFDNQMYPKPDEYSSKQQIDLDGRFPYAMSDNALEPEDTGQV